MRALNACSPSVRERENGQPLAALSAPIWILQQCKDMRKAADRHSNRRIAEAAAAFGLRAVVVHPRWVEVRTAPGAAIGGELWISGRRACPPIAVLTRSGLKLTKRAFRLMKTLEGLGAHCSPSVDAYLGAKDKLIMARRLAAAGLSTPDTISLEEPGGVERAEGASATQWFSRMRLAARGSRWRFARAKPICRICAPRSRARAR